MAKLVGDEHYSIITDHLGTPNTVFDKNGNQVWSADISVWGELRNLQDDKNFYPFRYPGQYEDSETGLYYNRFRYYDPEAGRYVSQDPIRLVGGNQFYNYANDPALGIDPLGLMCRNAWNAFQRHHKGMFKDVKEAASEYRKLLTERSPWPIGYDYTKHVRRMEVGDTFQMIVNRNSENWPGKFATTDAITSVDFVRNKLAILEVWKPSLDLVVTYRVRKPFDVFEGPVGPQIDKGRYLEGGAHQLNIFDDKIAKQLRPNLGNENTSDPFLDILDIKPLG